MRHSETTITVGGYIATAADTTNMKTDVCEFALDQRVFGPRRLLVAFADRDGHLLSLAHAPRTDPPELALECCVDYLGAGAVAAVVFCDEPVEDGPPPTDLGPRFAAAAAICAGHGIHLVDWIACDDRLFRSNRLALDPNVEWWNVP